MAHVLLPLPDVNDKNRTKKSGRNEDMWMWMCSPGSDLAHFPQQWNSIGNEELYMQ